MKKNHNTVSRRKAILQLLSDSGEVMVPDLSRRFKVSEVTIRNDLDQLEQKNLLIRARGGAIRYVTTVAEDQGLDDKSMIHLMEKTRIGQRAAQFVNESDTIILDSGSTTAELVKHLPDFNDLTVITNALNIASLLNGKSNVNLIMPGGYLRKKSLSLVGPMAEKTLRSFNVDRLFLSVDGFDTRHGLYTPNIEEARLNEIMIETAAEVIVVTDSSKFARRSLVLICTIDQIDKVITDSNISDDDRKRLEDAGVVVITV